MTDDQRNGNGNGPVRYCRCQQPPHYPHRPAPAATGHSPREEDHR